MKKIAYGLCLLIVILFYNGCKTDSDARKVLVFTKTKGYHHASIPAGVAAIEQIGKENNFSVDVDSNSNVFNDDDLKKYKAVIFLSTTGNILNSDEQVAFQRYIEAGGGYMGIHAAAGCRIQLGLVQ
jgi:cytochrome c